MLKRLIQDQEGGEILEWALVCGLIIVACITTVAAFGGRVFARWTSLNGSM